MLRVKQLATQLGVYSIVPDLESPGGALRTYQEATGADTRYHYVYARTLGAKRCPPHPR